MAKKDKLRIESITNKSRFAARIQGARDSRNEGVCLARINSYKAAYETFRGNEYAALERAQQPDRVRSAELVSLIRELRRSLALPIAPLPENASDSERKNHTRAQLSRTASQRNLSMYLTELSKIDEQIKGRQTAVRARVEKGHAIFCAFVNAYIVGVLKRNRDFTIPTFTCGNGYAEYITLHADSDNQRTATLAEREV